MIPDSGYRRMIADLLSMDSVIPSNKQDRESVMTHTCFVFNYPFNVHADKWQHIAMDLYSLLDGVKYALILDHEQDVTWAKSVGFNAIWRPIFTRSLVDQDKNHIERFNKIIHISFSPMGESIHWLIGGVMMRTFNKERKYIELRLDINKSEIHNE